MFFKISLRLCYIQPDHEKQNKLCVFMSTKVKNKKTMDYKQAIVQK